MNPKAMKKWEELMDRRDNQKLIDTAEEALTKALENFDVTPGKSEGVIKSLKTGDIVLGFRKKPISKEEAVMNKLDGKADEFEWVVEKEKK